MNMENWQSECSRVLKKYIFEATFFCNVCQRGKVGDIEKEEKQIQLQIEFLLNVGGVACWNKNSKKKKGEFLQAKKNK